MKIQPTHRHYKGGFYKLLHQAMNESDLQPVVVYQSCHDGTVWVRTTEDFNSVVIDEYDGSSQRRFEPVVFPIVDN